MRFTFLLAFATFVLTFIPVAFTQAQTTSSYQIVPCPFDTSEFALNLECGLLGVPENRTDPESHTIALSFVRVISESAAPQPDPIVYLTGGPGESAVAGFLPYLDSEAGQSLLADRDWIVVDQRGTGYSVPRLECNLFGLTRLSDGEALTDAVQSCAARYRTAGVDLTGYNTRENAADFAELRTAMGYESWNLYGVSYGTNLGITILRNHPEGIRSAIFDSVAPPDRDPDVPSTDTLYKLDVLARIFDQCASTSVCDEAFPDLEQRFTDLVARWNEAPEFVGEFPLSGDFLLFALTNTSVLSRDVVQNLPALIDAIANGDLEPLEALVGGVATATDEPLGYEVEAVAANDGMGFFVDCNDTAAFTTAAQFAEFRETLPAYGISLLDASQRYWQACGAAGLTGLYTTIPESITRDIPVLMLEGEYDPATPVQLAERAEQSLSQSQIIIFPGEGHAVLFSATTSCPASLITNFINDPAAPLDTDCIANDYESPVFGA